MTASLEFMDVSSQLTFVGNRLVESATVTRNGLTRVAGTNPLLHIVDVATEPDVRLSLHAYRLSFGRYCVRASLVVGLKETLQAVWTLNENAAPSNESLCARCLRPNSHIETCSRQDVPLEEVPILELADTLVAWMQTRFKANPNFSRRVTATK